ncbi:MAG: phytase [Archangium sp.]|nr:phytase [Archangium sp.]
MKPLFLSIFVASSAFAQLVPWAVETSAIPSTGTGDPTFVFVPGPPGNGVRLIVGTDPNLTGLFLWEPGQLPDVLPVGLVRSADARGPLLAVTSSTENTVLMFHVSDAGIVTQLDTGNFAVPSPGQVAFAENADGGFELWVDTSSPSVEHFAISPVAGGSVTFASLGTISVPETPSGLAVDDRLGRLYVALPTLGVLTVEPDGAQSFLISIDAGTLGGTMGGIDLYLSADGGALLFSTAPNEEEIKVHEHAGTTATFRTTLEIGDTDGGPGRSRFPRFLDVFAQAMPGFPRGVLVVEDGLMHNYKLVSLADVDAVFPLPPAYAFTPTAPSDAGVTDGGAVDAGAPSDGGTGGGGGDGGAGGGAGGGGGAAGGGSGSPSRPSPNSVDPLPTCGCTGGSFAMLPALLLLWWIRRLRS